jgi:hypothetical protein
VLPARGTGVAVAGASSRILAISTARTATDGMLQLIKPLIVWRI